MKKALGFVFLLLGVGLLGWVAYNVLVQQQPEFRPGAAAIPSFAFAAGLIYVGQKWMRE